MSNTASRIPSEPQPDQFQTDTRAPRAMACILLAAIGGVLLAIPTLLHILGLAVAHGVLIAIAAAVCGLAVAVLQQVTAPPPRQELR